jgi:deoxyribonuclease-4
MEAVSRGRIGAHIRAEGGLHRVFDRAQAWGAAVIQVFTANPRRHAPFPLTDERLDAYFAARQEHGNPLVVSHASYLINLASPDDDVRARSARVFAAELERCARLDVPYVVLHMGAATSSEPSAAREHFVAAMNRLVAESSRSVIVCLETSAGQGTALGRHFEDLGWALERLDPPERFAVCFDTCHVFAAGYDIRDDAYDATWETFDQQIGCDRLRALHLNDSKTALGSCVDRHEHIGKGHIGMGPFRRVLHDPRLAHLPCFIETPDDLQSHARNLSTLKGLAAEDATAAGRGVDCPARG